MKVVAMLGTADPAVLRVAQSLGEVTALAVSADGDALSGAQAATQRVRVWDEALAELPAVGSDREAVLATVLAAAARRLEAQLLVVAETTVGYLGSALAEQLNLSHISHVVEATLLAGDTASPQLRVVRRCLHGVQRLRGPAAAVLCVLPGSERRPAPISASDFDSDDDEDRTAMEATWSLADIGLVRSELPRPLVRVLSPPQKTYFPPRCFDSLEALVARLRQDGLG